MLLASSRGTSNGPDWLDCRVLVREMQTALEARIELVTAVRRKGDTDELYVKATAYPYLSTEVGARQSVSLSAPIPDSSPQMGTAVIFRLLLALDYEASKAWSVKQAT